MYSNGSPFSGLRSHCSSESLRYRHVAALEVWGDDRDKAAERGLHPGPVDHLVVWSLVELDERGE